MTLALEANNIQKKFGHFTALNGISLQIPRGEFVTLFGRNGAGKTTFLRVAATLARPTHGTLRIEGFDIREEPEKARRRIGFLSHNTFIYRDLSALENLRFFCRLYGADSSNDRLMGILERVGLRRRANDNVRSFSRGLQQRVGIARVLLHDPSVILLDEPYTGLDAQAVAMLNNILDEFVQAGRTIVLTTHDLEHGLRAATQVIIMDRGKIVLSAAAGDSQVREAYARHILQGAPR